MTAARSDTSLAAALLTQRLVDATVAPLKASEYWDLLDRVADPARLLGIDQPAMVALGLEETVAERAARLLDAATSFAFELDRLEQSGVRVVASVDEDYPPSLLRLGRGAPPLLHVAGEVSLLHGDLLGIVGSRQVDEAGALVAQGAARAASDNGFGVASGGAKGVDRLAMTAALDCGGVAVGVLADSLLRTTRDPDVRRAITDGLACLCTPYKPSAGFSVANAMGRNKLIYAMSAATLVVASALEKGGTWEGAVEAIRRQSAPVLVWRGAGAGPGNDRLIAMGGIAVDSLDHLFPLPAAAAASDPTEQLAMEV
jgi:predicted Rossmann fold nucleotide-binding protein DprA/Smf involved in DNA uptake